MMGRLVRSILWIACAAAIIYTPAAHTLKLFIGTAPSYNGVVVTEMVRQRIPNDDLILFGDDRFMPPLVDLFARKYEGSNDRRVYWTFPTLMGNRELEEDMIFDFLCLISGNLDRSITWLLNRSQIETGETPVGKESSILETTFRRNLIIDFTVDAVHYETQDSIFLRGGIKRIMAKVEDEPEVTLYPDPRLTMQCTKR